ncbi:hypothetical protein HY632_04590 [Candidatus Uhrbacteria bacterium]|nr:hypothetical protein [Candidatus Uhrbacteria bacterium]
MHIAKIIAPSADPIPNALRVLGIPAERRPLPTRSQVTTQLERLRQFKRTAHDRLLPIEQPAALRSVDMQIAALESGVAGFTRVPTEKLREVLQWRNDAGLPVLAPFSVASPACTFVVQSLGNGNFLRQFSPSLPMPLQSCYDDVFAKLEARRSRGRDIQCSVSFSGTIPADVRAIIMNAQRFRLNDIRILAEVDRWQIEERESSSLRVDPIVIGFDGNDFWLLATFDLTPLESFVQEICTGSEPVRGRD